MGKELNELLEEQNRQKIYDKPEDTQTPKEQKVQAELDADCDEGNLPKCYQDFCQMFVNGGMDYAGQADKCYYKVVRRIKDKARLKTKARDLLRKAYIEKEIIRLATEGEIDLIGQRLQIENTLFKIMDEGAKVHYKNKWGRKANPAQMRAVAVSAAKQLSDMKGFNAPDELNVNGKNAEGAAIQFITVVPEKKKKDGDSKN